MNVKRLSSATLGHLSIDVLNSSVAIILTFLSKNKFDLTISQIGVGAMLYTFVAAFSQPLFGSIADHLRGRWLGAVGVLWTAAFFALAPFAPSFTLLVTCLTIGALGSGALHAFGMLNATSSGGPYPTMATSLFFLGGQSGLALGPVVAGLLLQAVGMAALPFMAATVLPAVMLMVLFQHTPLPEDPSKPAAQSTGDLTPLRRSRATMVLVVAFVLFIALRATTTQSFSTLLPKYFDDLGYSTNVYGLMIGALNFAGALGTFVGGFLGDRFNRRVILFTSTILSVPFCFMLLNVSGWAYYGAAFMAGLLLNIPHSILLVMAQQLLPARKGLIGGLVLGFMFASGAATAALASWFADWTGLPIVLMVLAFMPLGAALCALFFPATRGVASPMRQPLTQAVTAD
jgi:FSR family fosmidomycin resistance protein-like MFS transporter